MLNLERKLTIPLSLRSTVTCLTQGQFLKPIANYFLTSLTASQVPSKIPCFTALVYSLLHFNVLWWALYSPGRKPWWNVDQGSQGNYRASRRAVLVMPWLASVARHAERHFLRLPALLSTQKLYTPIILSNRHQTTRFSQNHPPSLFISPGAGPKAFSDSEFSQGRVETEARPCNSSQWLWISCQERRASYPKEQDMTTSFSSTGTRLQQDEHKFVEENKRLNPINADLLDKSKKLSIVRTQPDTRVSLLHF